MRHNLLAFLIIALFLTALAAGGCKNNPVGPKTGFSKSNGLIGDGKTDNTKRIQAIIDSTSANGGGTIVFEKGTYLTGPFTLKSNITLEIKNGAILAGTKDEKAYYPAGVDTNGPLPSSLQPLIHSDHATNIKITGQGAINGNGQEWWTLYNNAKKNSQPLPARPRLMELDYTNNIVIDSVSIENAPMFNIFLRSCRNVKVEYAKITASASSPNTDGIDPATSHNVTITHCTIDNGDDNIAIKSGSPDSSDPNAGTSQIYIENNTFLHGHGVSIGSETNGGVDSIYVKNNTFSGTTNGFRIKTSRSLGGNVRNVVYDNNQMTNVANPILFTCYYPNIPLSDKPQPITKTTPNIHDITIQNLKSTINSQFGGTANAGMVIGLPEQHMTNITLKNVSIDVSVIPGSSGLEIRNASVDTSGVSIKVPPIHVNASSESLTGLTAGYEVPSSGTTKEVQKVQPDASTSGPSGTNTWPDSSSYNAERFIEFTMNPTGTNSNGNNYYLTVDSLSMRLGSKGTSAMDAAIYYAVGSTYSSPTQLASLNNLTENGVKYVSLTGESTSYLNVSVYSGQKIFIRVYPWLPGGTTSTTKYMYIGDVRIYGHVHYPTADGSMEWHLTSVTKQQPSILGGAYILQNGASLQ